MISGYGTTTTSKWNLAWAKHTAVWQAPNKKEAEEYAAKTKGMNYVLTVKHPKGGPAIYGVVKNNTALFESLLDVTANPTHIRVRTPNGTFPAVAKRVAGKVKIFVTAGVARKINPQKRWTSASMRRFANGGKYPVPKGILPRLGATVIQGPNGVYFIQRKLGSLYRNMVDLYKFNTSTGASSWVDSHYTKALAIKAAKGLAK